MGTLMDLGRLGIDRPFAKGGERNPMEPPKKPKQSIPSLWHYPFSKAPPTLPPR